MILVAKSLYHFTWDQRFGLACSSVAAAVLGFCNSVCLLASELVRISGSDIFILTATQQDLQAVSSMTSS